MQRFFSALIAAFLILLFAVSLAATPVYARPPLALDSPSVILVEATTGRVLYSRNERDRRYPASMTKMLTALVAIEYLALDDIITVGDEIRNMPAGFATNVHFEGETISVEVLLYSLLVRSANETGRILALNTVRQIQGRRNIPFYQAEHTFSVLMNEKARSLGAEMSHFNNPFGSHNDNHFTTAYDLALITRAFMQNPILAEISGTRTFEGDSLGGLAHDEPNVREYEWTSTNQMLPHAPFGHPYIIGGKAGFTTPAGHSLAAAAYHDGLSLVTVVLGGTDAERWQDTRRLMDYGFDNFRFREIASANQILAEVAIENPRRGDPTTLEIISSAAYTTLISHENFAGITRTLSFDPLLYIEAEVTTLRAPIEENQEIGRVTYSADGEVLFEAPIFAAREVIERTFDSDMDYRIAAFFGGMFTRRGLPYWIGFIGTAIGVTGVIIAIRTHRAGKNGYSYSGKRRYSRYE